MVSVIIPTYNRLATIARAVDSVLSQTYPDIELIIADDGSTDGTCESLAGYGDRVRIVKQPNRGPSAARNLGARAARGEILSFLDSDDSWLPDKIARQVEVLERGGPEVPCCICNAALDAAPGRPATSFAAAAIPTEIGEGFILNPEMLLATRFLLFNQVVAIRRAVFEKIGGFNEDLWLLEDHEIALRLSLEGRWGFVSAPLVEKYESEGNLGGTARQDHTRHLMAVENVLTLFLTEHPELAPALRQAVERERRGLREAVRGSRLAADPSAARAAAGRAWLFVQRVRRALQVRSPGWPRPVIVPLATKNR
jgi:glycosyltransferase involved in cell wall biosynthesis